uniref:Uncharacterized protein n=1 Tax=Plectus sambesii TaxID=2011161 RepID=A0A914WHD7_9BILA
MNLIVMISRTLFCLTFLSLRTIRAIGKCPVPLTPLAETSLNEYISTFDHENDVGRLGQIGIVDIHPVAGGYQLSCSCQANIGDYCYLEFDMDYSTEFETPIKADGTYDLVMSSLIKCGNGGENILKEIGQPITTYACYSYRHGYASCDGTGKGIEMMSISQLRQFLSTVDGGKSNFLVEFGTVEVVPGSDDNSLTLTCQCVGDGDVCNLGIFGHYNSLSHSRAEYSSPNRGEGTFDLITSESIECNDDGDYVLATNDSNVKPGMYACYSTTAKKLDCSGETVSSLTSNQIEKFLATYDIGYSYQYKLIEMGSVEVVPSNDGKSFTMVCQCTGGGDMCYFEFSSNFSTFLNHDFKENFVSIRDDGNYDLITSGQIVCDAKGAYLRGNSAWGYTIESYACYSATLVPNDESSDTIEVTDI